MQARYTPDLPAYQAAQVQFQADHKQQQGDAEAQYQLAALYRSGRGVPQNHAQAADWYRKAAQQGYVKAQYNLAVMHENGWGVDKDSALAQDWYRKAAGQGHAMAQAKLGLAKGRGMATQPAAPKDAQQDPGKQLLRAATKGDAGEVRGLILRGAPVDAPDEYGGTALMRACKLGHVEVVKVLLAVVLGGGPIPRRLLEWARASGYRVLTTYGMSETASGIAAGGADAETLADPTAARPLPGVQLRIEPDGASDGSGEILRRIGQR